MWSILAILGLSAGVGLAVYLILDWLSMYDDNFDDYEGYRDYRDDHDIDDMEKW